MRSTSRLKRMAEVLPKALFRAVARPLPRAWRLRSRKTDGYVYNAYLDEDEGGIDEFGGRLTLVWEPSDTFSANLKYTYMERDRDGANSATWRFLSPAERNQQVPNRSAFANTAYAIMDVFFPDFPAIAGRDFTTYKDNNYGQSKDDGIGIGLRPDSSEDEVENISLSLTWELGGGTLTSVTGFAAMSTSMMSTWIGCHCSSSTAPTSTILSSSVRKFAGRLISAIASPIRWAATSTRTSSICRVRW